MTATWTRTHPLTKGSRLSQLPRAFARARSLAREISIYPLGHMSPEGRDPRKPDSLERASRESWSCATSCRVDTRDRPKRLGDESGDGEKGRKRGRTGCETGSWPRLPAKWNRSCVSSITILANARASGMRTLAMELYSVSWIPGNSLWRGGVVVNKEANLFPHAIMIRGGGGESGDFSGSKEDLEAGSRMDLLLPESKPEIGTPKARACFRTNSSEFRLIISIALMWVLFLFYGGIRKNLDFHGITKYRCATDTITWMGSRHADVCYCYVHVDERQRCLTSSRT